METYSGLEVLAGCWLAYFALHSWLASLTMKHWVGGRWPAFMPAYRLTFNGLAVLLLLPVLVLTYSLPALWLWRWEGFAAWLSNALSLLALAGVVYSSRGYDMLEFLGLRQWRGRVTAAEDQEGFRISGFHRYVRHPWYFFALVLIWARDMNTATLLSSVLLTGYFIVGSKLEERKLLVMHGEAYRRYMARVAGLLPWPGKILSPEEAQVLLKGPSQ